LIRLTAVNVRIGLSATGAKLNIHGKSYVCRALQNQLQ
jgi:hypothetical protein